MQWRVQDDERHTKEFTNFLKEPRDQKSKTKLNEQENDILKLETSTTNHFGCAQGKGHVSSKG